MEENNSEAEPHILEPEPELISSNPPSKKDINNNFESAVIEVEDHQHQDAYTETETRSSSTTSTTCQCCKHSKFCFSRDVSGREEKMLRSSSSNTAPSPHHTNSKGKGSKKYVSFDRKAPVFIGHGHQCCGCDVGSDSDDGCSKGRTRSIRFQDLSDLDSVSSSNSEIFNERFKSSVADGQSAIISKAEKQLASVLSQLQSLWLVLHDNDVDSPILKTNMEPKDLLQTVSLIALVTDKLSMQHREYLNQATGPAQCHKLQNANEVLEEELKNAKNKISCLESEIKYYSKENALLNCEVKELAFRAATNQNFGGERKGVGDNGNGTMTKAPAEAEIYYKNPRREFDCSDSKSLAAVADGSRNFPPFQCPNATCPYNFNNCSTKNVDSQNEILVLKRETEMDSIIRDFNEKFRTTHSLHAQIQIYDEHLENWKRMVHATHEEKQQMFHDLEAVVQEHKAILKERNHYEFILKLIIKEKTNDDFNVEALLNNLIMKLQEPSAGDGSWIETSLLEGAVRTLQQQSDAQREEICYFKHKLSECQMQVQVQSEELEACNKKIAQFVDELNSTDAKLKVMQEEATKKCEKIQDLCNEAVSTKANLEKKLEERESEVKELEVILVGLKKCNKRQNIKYQDMKKANVMLLKEVENSKGNADYLAEIISQLRSGLNDQKAEWTERLRVSSEEGSQIRQHCEWLKSQMEQISQQLKDALDRLRCHEMDKVQLAQQLLLAEEERRLVDRKLHELRTALQGDTGLRDALIERNEELQMEINRLRLSKPSNPTGTGAPRLSLNGPLEVGMGNGNTEEILGSTFHPPGDTHHVSEKLSMKKTCYTTCHRRPDGPRTAVLASFLTFRGFRCTMGQANEGSDRDAERTCKSASAIMNE